MIDPDLLRHQIGARMAALAKQRGLPPSAALAVLAHGVDTTVFSRMSQGRTVPDHTSFRENWQDAAALLPPAGRTYIFYEYSNMVEVRARDLALELGRLYDDPDLLGRMSRAAYVRATEHRFDWREIGRHSGRFSMLSRPWRPAERRLHAVEENEPCDGDNGMAFVQRLVGRFRGTLVQRRGTSRAFAAVSVPAFASEIRDLASQLASYNFLSEPAENTRAA